MLRVASIMPLLLFFAFLVAVAASSGNVVAIAITIVSLPVSVLIYGVAYPREKGKPSTLSASVIASPSSSSEAYQARLSASLSQREIMEFLNRSQHGPSMEAIDSEQIVGGRDLEKFVGGLLRKEGYDVVDHASFESLEGADMRFDFLATKADKVMVVETKWREVASPDMESFLLRLKAANLAEMVSPKKLVPMFVAKDYTRAAFQVAQESGAEIIRAESLIARGAFPVAE